MSPSLCLGVIVMGSQTIEQAKAILDGSTFATGSKTAAAIDALFSHCATLEAENAELKALRDRQARNNITLNSQLDAVKADLAEAKRQAGYWETDAYRYEKSAHQWKERHDASQADLAEALELLERALPYVGAFVQWRDKYDALLKRRGEG